MAAVSMSPTEATAVIDEVKRRGFDPGKVRACMPSSDLPKLGGIEGVVGCNMWDRCPFGLTKNGGFKGRTWRPKNIIYYLEPNDGTTHAKEDVGSCFWYVQYLQNKARDGRIDIEEGRDGEIIQVIGQEGETYTENVMVKDPASLNPLVPNWINRTTTKTCPEFVHASSIAGQQHERDIRSEARKRMADDPQAQMGPPRVKGNPNDDWEQPAAEDADLTLGAKSDE